MGKPIVIQQTPVNVYQVKSALDAIKARDSELTFRGGKVEEYLQQFTTLDPKQAEEMYKAIEGLDIPRLKDIHIHKIIDVMPKYLEDLKTVLQGYLVTIKDDQLTKILDVVANYA